MQRQIKFRAWDGLHQRFKYPKLWDNTMPSNWDKFYYLQQYTGVNDKNGVEIFEGDIVECYDNDAIEWPQTSKVHIGFIEYSGTSFWLKVGDVLLPHWTNAENIEVKGNLHENKELLEKCSSSQG